MNNRIRNIRPHLPLLAWLVSLAGLLGSLYFSEVRHFAPCALCWLQRICLYPLVLILPVGIFRRDKGVAAYVLPLSLIGTLIAVYHNLIYYHLIGQAKACVDISCITEYVNYFGFVSIPLLSLAAFVLVDVFMLFYTHHEK